MKVLLQVDITQLGYLGDVVDVAAGYARNYLLPQGLATEPTEGNIKAIEEERAQKAEERQLARQEQERAAQKIDSVEVAITALANEQGHLFGSVAEADIATALRDKGYEVQNKHVVLAEHIRILGTHEVTLRFAEDIEAKVTVEVVRPKDQDDDASSQEPDNV